MATTAEEELLCRYCPESLTQEYSALSQAEQATLREALLSTLQSRLMNFMMQQNDHKKTSKIQRSDGRLYPLFQTLSRIFPPDILNKDAVELCGSLLCTWGATSTSSSDKMAHYQQVVAVQKQGYAGRGSHNMVNTSAAVTKRSNVSNSNSSKIYWDKLQKVSFSKLSLFQTARGSYIEGKIVGEPIQPMVGGTTLIQETNTRDVLLVCFYNLLPDGICGQPAEALLRQELPLGATLRIAEPFFKIFGDGQRGIRVDSPREMNVIRAGSSSQKKAPDAATAKENGNQFVAKRQYMAAIDSYLGGIRHPPQDIVPTLLSNRAQAWIQLEDWEQAFCDAAASLTIRPESKKTWARYKKALSELQKGIEKDAACMNRVIFEGLIQSIALSSATSDTVRMTDAEDFKKKGNQAFQKDKLEEAIELWSEALSACGETVRAMLANWALCSLEIRNFGDVIAATCASLRIGLNDKALFRLCQSLSFLGNYDLAQSALGFMSASSSTNQGVANLQIQLQRCLKFEQIFMVGEAEDPLDAWSLLEDTPPCMGNWHGPVETFLSEGKGRGLRATQDMDPGAVVLVEWPLVCVVVDSGEATNLLISQTKEKNVHAWSSASLRPMVINRLKREVVLAQIMSRLSDGSKRNPLVPLSDLLVSLETFPLLLPTHREYCLEDKEMELSADRVDDILSMNSHGTHFKKSGTEADHTELYPAVSMMNHSSKPNCTFADINLPLLSMVTTCQPVKAGDELFMKYHDDETVETKWGIKATD